MSIKMMVTKEITEDDFVHDYIMDELEQTIRGIREVERLYHFRIELLSEYQEHAKKIEYEIEHGKGSYERLIFGGAPGL